MTIQSRDGLVFDSIVFGEKEPGRWMAGSEVFRRYQRCRWPGRERRDQTARFTSRSPTHADGTIRLFRDGLPYGKSYKTATPVILPPERRRSLRSSAHFRPEATARSREP